MSCGRCQGGSGPCWAWQSPYPRGASHGLPPLPLPSYLLWLSLSCPPCPRWFPDRGGSAAGPSPAPSMVEIRETCGEKALPTESGGRRQGTGAPVPFLLKAWLSNEGPGNGRGGSGPSGREGKSWRDFLTGWAWLGQMGEAAPPRSHLLSPGGNFPIISGWRAGKYRRSQARQGPGPQGAPVSGETRSRGLQGAPV